MTRETIFSPDRRYRYTLWRMWGETETRFVQIIGLNPSTADEANDDPTIRRCIQFAKDWGYGGLCMTNAFAFKATDPNVMKKEIDPCGPYNTEHIHRVAKEAHCIVCAWGKDGNHLYRGTQLKLYLRDTCKLSLQCLGKNSDGTPKHPLYLKKDLKPIPFV